MSAARGESGHDGLVVAVSGKSVRVRLSPSAQAALRTRRQPLLVEMELFFSCLIRKQVRFRDFDQDAGAIPAGPNLLLRFHPVMTAACGKDYEGDEPPLTDFPIARARAFVPHWLAIDYRNHAWTGEFGFD